MTHPVDENTQKESNKKLSTMATQEIPAIIGGLSGFAMGSHACLSYFMKHKKVTSSIPRSFACFGMSSVGMSMLGAFLLSKASQRLTSCDFNASDEERLKRPFCPF